MSMGRKALYISAFRPIDLEAWWRRDVFPREARGTCALPAESLASWASRGKRAACPGRRETPGTGPSPIDRAPKPAVPRRRGPEALSPGHTSQTPPSPICVRTSPYRLRESAKAD